jgi:probable phosphoglycerate mutase
MTTFYLVRHGSNDMLPRALAGRLPGVHLNDQGRAEAERAVQRLKSRPIRHVFSSPMERCRETAEPIARAHNVPVGISEAINEVDFGEWQGAEMPALSNDARWKRWTKYRSGHRLPQGELMVVIQARVVSEMIRLKDLFPGDHIVLVSHGDPIRAALCHWLGIPLDFMARFEVSPGSVSVVMLDQDQPLVHCINGL